jgi:hypothetical protein
VPLPISFFFSLRPPPPVARPGIAFVALDDARKEGQEQLLLRGGERRHYPLLRGEGRRPQPAAQAGAAPRRTHEAHATVPGMNATSDQPHALKSIDPLADTRRVDTELRSEAALIETWTIRDRHQHRVFTGCESRGCGHLGHHAQADLMKAPR